MSRWSCSCLGFQPYCRIASELSGRDLSEGSPDLARGRFAALTALSDKKQIGPKL